MTVTTTTDHLERAREAFVQQFPSVERGLSAAPSIVRARRAAIERFAELGLPSLKHEEWRYTSLGPIAKREFALAARIGAAGVTLAELEGFLVRGACARFVFVDGVFAPELSSLDAAPDGLRVESLASVIDQTPERAAPHFTEFAGFEDDPFSALNTAFAREGAVIEAARGAVVERPVHLLHVTTRAADGVVSHPRVIINAEEASQLAIVESHVALADAAHFSNVAVDLRLGAGAIMKRTKLNAEAPSAFHLHRLRVRQDRDSDLHSHEVCFGAALVRNTMRAVLEGPGANCDLSGLYLVSEGQHVDNHLRVEHAAPRCNSREFFKGILDGDGRGVFSGRIFVHKDAQKTDAKQTNANLLLSDRARADTKPQLEIFADDVKCTHAAITGELDEEAIFYLRTRGVPAESARRMLVRSFAGEALEDLKSGAIAEQVERLAQARFPAIILETEALEL